MRTGGEKTTDNSNVTGRLLVTVSHNNNQKLNVIMSNMQSYHIDLSLVYWTILTWCYLQSLTPPPPYNRRREALCFFGLRPVVRLSVH